MTAISGVKGYFVKQQTAGKTSHWLACLGVALAMQAGTVDADESLFPADGLQADQLLVIEGDILVGPRLSARGMGVRGVGQVWSDGIIPYIVDDSLPATTVTQIQAAIDTWNANSSVSLKPREGMTPREGRDFLRFQAGPGCASWVGRQGGEQAVWVAPTCSSGSLMHEIGHAIGLEHEHTRPDRDQYIEILWDNIDPDKRHNFDTTESRSRVLGSYDYFSIMHYGPTFFSRNGEVTIRPLLETRAQLGQRVQLSQGDLASVDLLYGTDVSLSTQLSRIGGGQTEVALLVTNQHLQGAHELTLNVRILAGRMLSQSDNAWRCSGDGVEVSCQLARLAGETTSRLTLLIDGVLEDADLSAEVRMKTPDVDLSDNGSTALGDAMEPDLGEAAGDGSDVLMEDVTTGQGSVGWISVLMLLLGAWRRF